MWFSRMLFETVDFLKKDTPHQRVSSKKFFGPSIWRSCYKNRFIIVTLLLYNTLINCIVAIWTFKMINFLYPHILSNISHFIFLKRSLSVFRISDKPQTVPVLSKTIPVTSYTFPESKSKYQVSETWKLFLKLLEKSKF